MKALALRSAPRYALAALGDAVGDVGDVRLAGPGGRPNQASNVVSATGPLPPQTPRGGVKTRGTM